jgi:hypothetical protein
MVYQPEIAIQPLPRRQFEIPVAPAFASIDHKRRKIQRSSQLKILHQALAAAAGPLAIAAGL